MLEIDISAWAISEIGKEFNKEMDKIGKEFKQELNNAFGSF